MPGALDEKSFTTTLHETLERDFPALTAEQRATGIDLYLKCLRKALLPLEDYTLTIIGMGVLRNETLLEALRKEQSEGLARLERLLTEALADGGDPEIRELAQRGGVNIEGGEINVFGDVAGRDIIQHHYATPHRPAEVPFMAEDLPDDFVQRSQEFKQIVALLTESEGGSKVAITAALRGAGGYGKTTLATAICHDEQIRAAYPDGVLWVTLGEQLRTENLPGKINNLIGVLTGEPPNFTDLPAARTRLVEALEERRTLLIVDDVWQAAHLAPFLQGAPHCARLVTTRNSDTLNEVPERVNVDAMKSKEAVALLGAGVSVNGQHDILQALAGRLGEWPLLLKLAGGVLRERVQDGESVAHAVRWVSRAFDKRGLTAFDARNTEDRTRAVALTLEVSLAQLDDEERTRFAEMVVFPEDVAIPLTTLTRYWAKSAGLDEFDTEELCQRFYRLSLLQSFDLRSQQVGLHDVVRQYLIDQARAGEGLQALHATLLAAHRPESGQWASLPVAEPYLWEYLAYHHLQAADWDGLYALLTDFDFLEAPLPGDLCLRPGGRLPPGADKLGR